MKKVFVLVLLMIGLSVSLTSCKDAKDAAKDAVETTKDAAKKTGDAVKDAAEKTGDAVKDAAEKTGDAVKAVAGGNDEQLAKGKKLTKVNGCIACHKEDAKSVGPSYKEVAQVYKEKKGNMVKFLKGNADPIVDPPQFAVMKANLPITQKMGGDDLAALVAYIRSLE